MPGPTFTTNEGEISRLEGLYIIERDPPAVIQGAFFGEVAIVGETVRGPVDVAVEIGSEARFKEVFGGRDFGSGGTLINKVWLSMLNKPFGTVHVIRAAAAAAATATKNFADVTPTNIIKVDATSRGSWGNNVTVAVQAASDGDATHFNLVATYLGKTYTYQNLNTNGSNDNLASVIGDDYGNVIVVTKLANGRPLNVSATALLGGTEGTIADTDFTASSRGLNVAANIKGVGVVMTAERMNATIKAYMLTLASASSDRLFLIGANSETVSLATTITDAASYRSDRIVYCFNHPYTLDPEVGTEVVTSPTGWMASILSQVDVDINPGEEDAKDFTTGITRLYNEAYSRADYISMREAGIAGLENDEGYAFVSAIVNDLTSGKTQITRRRCADFLQLSPAKELKHMVKKKNTKTRRDAIIGLLDGFLGGLKDAERVVEAYELLSNEVNTQPQRDLGIERILMRVKLINHILELVLETEIGEVVTILAR